MSYFTQCNCRLTKNHVRLLALQLSFLIRLHYQKKKGVLFMNIADRIQNLRKVRGISQEELADQVGVSRQAVSKWESEQSVPDIDKILLMSEYFDVTTDYILKGIETRASDKRKGENAGICMLVATMLNFIGLIISCAIWYEKQLPMALVIGLVFMALGCMVFGIGLADSTPESVKQAKRSFWTFNIWFLCFLPLSFLYNLLFTGATAPYPLLRDPVIAFPIFWLVYIGICLGVILFAVSKRNK